MLVPGGRNRPTQTKRKEPVPSNLVEDEIHPTRRKEIRQSSPIPKIPASSFPYNVGRWK